MGAFGISQPVRRTEDPIFLTGQGRYVDDIKLDDTLHAIVLRSPHAHANIKSIDTSRAATAPGVYLVLTGADYEAAGLGAMPYNDPPTPDWDPNCIYTPQMLALATNKVRFVGDGIAFIVADSVVAAQDAAELITVDYETLPAATGTATATDPDIVAGRSIFSHGFYAQGGYMVWPETIEITARISTVYGNEGANDGAATEVGPGINWFINGHRLKLQTDVMYYDISANAPRPTTNLERNGPDAPPSPSFTALGLREGEEGILWRTQLQLVF